jgi:hypothetical protein
MKHLSKIFNWTLPTPTTGSLNPMKEMKNLSLLLNAPLSYLMFSKLSLFMGISRLQ